LPAKTSSPIGMPLRLTTNARQICLQSRGDRGCGIGAPNSDARVPAVVDGNGINLDSVTVIIGEGAHCLAYRHGCINVLTRHRRRSLLDGVPVC